MTRSVTERPGLESKAVLAADGLRVESSTGKSLIDSVSFELRPGEILGVVGESGSGKTTSMMALLGVAHPGASVKSGRVSTRENSIDVSNPKTAGALRGRLVSYVPQSPGTALNPVMRVEAALHEVLRRSRASRDSRTERRSAMTDVLQKVGLPTDTEFLKRFPHQLSGGQQQRVCIAMSLISGADVLILDEPTTGLDVITQASVLKELERLRDELGLSMLYISHDLAVVSQIADRVMVMYRGRIVELGAVEEILNRPSHEYTRSLLAASLDYRHAPAGQFAVADREQDVSETTDRPLRPPILSARELTIEHVSRGKVVASVDDVSFDIERGSCVALLGESGSGKSTIARAVAGLKERKSGVLALAGEELAPAVGKRTGQQRRRLQMVFQNSSAALNPRESVGTAILRAQSQMSKAEAERAGNVEHLLELVRLPATIRHRMPRELSGGERQRVCIARALGAAPDLLVCDEITSALDVSVQASVLKLLKELQRELGLSLLFITHDMGVVSYIADEVVVLERGRVCEQGPTPKVLHDPQTSYVRQLMAAVPVLDRS